VYKTKQDAILGEKIAEREAQRIAGTWQPNREKDSLTMALGNREHPGRTRGVGVQPWIKGFPNDEGSYRSRDRRRQEQEAIDARVRQIAMEEARAEVRRQMEESQRTAGQGALEPPARTSPEVVTRRSSNASCPGGPHHTTGQVFSLCPFEIPPPQVRYWNGVSIRTRRGTIQHHASIPHGYCRVSVDEVMEGFEDYELDYEGGDGARSLLGEAVHSFILWYKRDVEISEDDVQQCSGPLYCMMMLPGLQVVLGGAHHDRRHAPCRWTFEGDKRITKVGDSSSCG